MSLSSWQDKLSSVEKIDTSFNLHEVSTLKLVQLLCSKTNKNYHFAAQKDLNMVFKPNKDLFCDNVGFRYLR